METVETMKQSELWSSLGYAIMRLLWWLYIYPGGQTGNLDLKLYFNWKVKHTHIQITGSVSPQPSYPAPHSWQDHPYDPSGPCHGWLLAD